MRNISIKKERKIEFIYKRKEIHSTTYRQLTGNIRNYCQQKTLYICRTSETLNSDKCFANALHEPSNYK